MIAEDIIRRPLVLTEKGTNLRENHNQYLFEVHPKANKIQIRDAVERLFQVSVREVRTMNVRGRMRRIGRTFLKHQNWKKAVVTLKDGEFIDLFEGA